MAAQVLGLFCVGKIVFFSFSIASDQPISATQLVQGQGGKKDTDRRASPSSQNNTPALRFH